MVLALSLPTPTPTRYEACPESGVAQSCDKRRAPGLEGTVIAGKYRLDSLLGEGGMGSVWRATNLQLEAPVAIKLLRAGQSSTELVERLRIEARAAAKLVHPGIVRMFDIGESETGEPFIVMELLSGESLSDMLRRGPLSSVNAVKLLLPIADALSLAHSRGVVHRDLKPDNIFICCEADAVQPKLLDFGIAKVTSTAASFVAHLTQSGTLLGSPEYMSPEQAYGSDDIDHRSDVWSFCVVLYEAVAGKMPFSAANCHALLRAIIEEPPASAALLTDADTKLWRLIERGLSKARAERPTSISDLGRELAEWLSQQGVHEDATGASLESKWLAKTSEPLDVSTLKPPALSAHPAGVASEADDATLVSVMHPAPSVAPESGAFACSSQPSLALPVRRRGWGALLVGAAALALAGSVAWSSRGSIRESTAADASLTQTAASRVAARAPAAAPYSAPSVPVEALPVEQPNVKSPVTAQRFAKAGANRGQAPSAPATKRQEVGVSRKLSPVPPSLPRSLPTRDAAHDLMEPY